MSKEIYSERMDDIVRNLKRIGHEDDLLTQEIESMELRVKRQNIVV